MSVPLFQVVGHFPPDRWGQVAAFTRHVSATSEQGATRKVLAESKGALVVAVTRLDLTPDRPERVPSFRRGGKRQRQWREVR